MDVYVQANSSNRTYYKGFPVITENSRKTAIEWSGDDKPVEFPDELENLCVDGIEDRMNNKIFKLYALRKINGKMCRVYFDMYADAMLDVLQNGSVSEGIIKSPVVVIGRSKLAVKGGELHTAYLKEQSIKNAKAISSKELEVGKIYGTRGPEDGLYLYLGRPRGVGHVMIDVTVDEGKYTLRSWAKITTTTNLKFKNGSSVTFDKAAILNSLNAELRSAEQSLKWSQEELDKHLKGRGYYWRSEERLREDVGKAQKRVDNWKKAIEYANALDID